MAIIIDATALILLAKVSVLETFVSRNDIFTSEEVYSEVILGKDKGRFDSIVVDKLVQEKKIKIKTSDMVIKRKINNLFNLKGGELEVVSMAYKTGDFVLSDDRKCIRVAKALGVCFITSLDVITVLYKKKIITKQKAFNCISDLEKYGWYAKDIIKSYMEVVK